ncbi:Uncharacterised protein [Mycobacteroides abscessus subsp. abscessus]|nr:Uncharacterised protein [Mycobacteroides abscessus subsp. abscessus]
MSGSGAMPDCLRAHAITSALLRREPSSLAPQIASKWSASAKCSRIARAVFSFFDVAIVIFRPRAARSSTSSRICGNTEFSSHPTSV